MVTASQANRLSLLSSIPNYNYMYNLYDSAFECQFKNGKVDLSLGHDVIKQTQFKQSDTVEVTSAFAHGKSGGSTDRINVSKYNKSLIC